MMNRRAWDFHFHFQIVELFLAFVGGMNWEKMPAVRISKYLKCVNYHNFCTPKNTYNYHNYVQQWRFFSTAKAKYQRNASQFYFLSVKVDVKYYALWAYLCKISCFVTFQNLYIIVDSVPPYAVESQLGIQCPFFFILYVDFNAIFTAFHLNCMNNSFLKHSLL